MSEAYRVFVKLTLLNEVSPALKIIAGEFSQLDGAILGVTANLRALSQSGLSISANLMKAVEASRALGDSIGGLSRSSYVLDTMAAASADLARNLKAAQVAGVSLAGLPPGGIPRGSSGGAAGGGQGMNYGAPLAATGAAGVFGLYENSKLQDVNLMTAATMQLPSSKWAQMADELRDREFEYAKQYAFATRGQITPFAETFLSASRLLRTLSPDQQRSMIDTAMPYAAVEAKLKGVPLPEALEAFIGLAHQAGAYSQKDAAPLYESMMQASLTTHSSLGQISRAASYALPALHAAGANSSDVMLLIATMMQAGILNTKSGTWLNAMALNALPNTLGSGLFKNKLQNEALERLGLYKNGHSQFYQNGVFDLLKEVQILANARTLMTPEQFNAALRQGFGIQGQRAASLFSEPQVLQNLSALRALTAGAQAPVDIGKTIQALSTVAKADQTIANANMSLMNATVTFQGPVNAALSGASSFLGWTADYTKRHPVLGGAMDLGLGLGAAALLGGMWKGAKMGVGFLAGKSGTLLRAAPLVAGGPVGAAAGGAALGWQIGDGLNYLWDKYGKGYRDLDDGVQLSNYAKHRLADPMTSLMMENQRPIQVTTKINLDGREIAEVVTEHMSREASRPYAGASGFDPSMGLAPVGLSYAP